MVTSVPLDPTSILNSQRGFRAAPVQAGFMEQVLFLITLSYNGKIGLVPAPGPHLALHEQVESSAQRRFMPLLQTNLSSS